MRPLATDVLPQASYDSSHGSPSRTGGNMACTTIDPERMQLAGAPFCSGCIASCRHPLLAKALEQRFPHFFSR